MQPCFKAVDFFFSSQYMGERLGRWIFATKAVEFISFIRALLILVFLAEFDICMIVCVTMYIETER
jgi:hypothetical protein